MKHEDDFVECTTPAARRKHVAAKTWPRLTLCGHPARHHNDPYVLDDLPDCKQCGKSKQRQIDGRSIDRAAAVQAGRR